MRSIDAHRQRAAHTRHENAPTSRVCAFEVTRGDWRRRALPSVAKKAKKWRPPTFSRKILSRTPTRVDCRGALPEGGPVARFRTKTMCSFFQAVADVGQPLCTTMPRTGGIENSLEEQPARGQFTTELAASLPLAVGRRRGSAAPSHGALVSSQRCQAVSPPRRWNFRAHFHCGICLTSPARPCARKLSRPIHAVREVFNFERAALSEHAGSVCTPSAQRASPSRAHIAALHHTSTASD